MRNTETRPEPSEPICPECDAAGRTVTLDVLGGCPLCRVEFLNTPLFDAPKTGTS